MELRDFIVTPILLIIICVSAYLVRPYFTNSTTKKYFIPALFVKLFAALALGFLYQFYYNGGDTFNYHTHGSRHVWEAFMDSPIKGFTLLFSNGNYSPGIYQYASKIIFFQDPASFFIVQVAAVFDLITFSTYSATALLFAIFSFAGGWALFSTFYKRYPTLDFQIALCSLFIPSTIFWGSGILKDTIIISTLGFATYSIDLLFIQRRWKWSVVLQLIFSIILIFKVKLFILQAFIPACLCWFFYRQIITTRSIALRVLLFPLIIFFSIVIGYWSAFKIGEGDSKYSVDNIAKTAKITAYDIGFYTGRDAGSGYSLGELDGTLSNMISKAPQAINVTLFRPYLWEVKNPLMLLSAIEGSLLLFFFLYVLFSIRKRFFSAINNPDILFMLIFSIILAFAVGITSYNFGTLARYKIPLMPYFSLALVLIYYENKERKLSRFDSMEN